MNKEVIPYVDKWDEAGDYPEDLSQKAYEVILKEKHFFEDHEHFSTSIYNQQFMFFLRQH